MASIGLCQTIPSIPQEIFNLIIDEVALQSFNLDHGSRQLDTLKACSTVSRSFYFHSRQHIFSEIEFKLDTRGRRRASKLLKILGDNQNDGVICAIRSCNVTFDHPLATLRGATYRNSFERLYAGLRRTYLQISRKLRLEGGNVQIIEALDALDGAKRLEHLQIRGQCGLCPWMNDISDGIRRSLSSLCLKYSLKSLDLTRVLHVPDSLLRNILLTPNLRELRLSSLSIARSLPDTSVPTPVDACSSKLETLEITGLSFGSFLDILRSPVQRPSPYTISLPHLRKLTLVVPGLIAEREALWQFLLQVSSSLEFLQLEHLHWRSFDDLSSSPIGLGSLTSLRQLTVVTTTFDTYGYFSSKLKDIAKFLELNTLPTLPTTITSFTVDVYVHRSLKSLHRDKKMLWKDLRCNIGWSVLDDTLGSAPFSSLRKVVINVKLFYYDKGRPVSQTQLEQTIQCPRALLPSVDAEINLYTVYSCQSFLNRFQVI